MPGCTHKGLLSSLKLLCLCRYSIAPHVLGACCPLIGFRGTPRTAPPNPFLAITTSSVVCTWSVVASILPPDAPKAIRRSRSSVETVTAHAWPSALIPDDVHPTDQRRGHRNAWRPRYCADNRACLRSTLAGHRLGCADLRGYDGLPPRSPN